MGDGTIFKGQTLRELFESIDGMDVDAALATVERYNELCEKGVDEDYAKQAKYLMPVTDDGPYYAQRMGVGLCLVMMGGLESNQNAQVLDLERQVIKYPFRLSGHSHAMAMFYGKVAGENAAAGL